MVVTGAKTLTRLKRTATAEAGNDAVGRARRTKSQGGKATRHFTIAQNKARPHGAGIGGRPLPMAAGPIARAGERRGRRAGATGASNLQTDSSPRRFRSGALPVQERTDLPGRLRGSAEGIKCSMEIERGGLGMPRTLLAQLSPKEETTLRLIAHGITKPKYLRAADVSRLRNFGFAETVDGEARLTPLGVQRFTMTNQSQSTTDETAGVRFLAKARDDGRGPSLRRRRAPARAAKPGGSGSRGPR